MLHRGLRDAWKEGKRGVMLAQLQDYVKKVEY